MGVLDNIEKYRHHHYQMPIKYKQTRSNNNNHHINWPCNAVRAIKINQSLINEERRGSGVIHDYHIIISHPKDITTELVELCQKVIVPLRYLLRLINSLTSVIKSSQLIIRLIKGASGIVPNKMKIVKKSEYPEDHGHFCVRSPCECLSLFSSTITNFR